MTAERTASENTDPKPVLLAEVVVPALAAPPAALAQAPLVPPAQPEELVLAYDSVIPRLARDDDEAHLAVTRNRLSLVVGCARPAPPGRGKISLGNEELGRRRVAEPLHLGSRLLVAGRVAHAGLRERQVAHLVQQRERLRALRVAAVDEDDGGEGVGEREAAKLRHAEGTVRVVADDPVDGNGDAGGLDPVLEQSERLGGPRGTSPSRRRA